ncbi:MAG: hypothetical protein Q9M20_04595 [Mariprofundaceae bacterium]|nr:hypothetical protein [Mariprofundaceae bacterium]
MTQPMQEQLPINVSWNITSVAWKNHDNVMSLYDCPSQEFSSAPDFSDEMIFVGRVAIPMEWLLVRYIALPLKNPDMVDADMLFQELADSSDLDADDWWLTWRIQRCEDGIAGMVFGLPESLRESIQNHAQWSKAKEILIDGYERLQGHIHDTQACMVIDQDDAGVFFGVFDGQTWRGMRRLNHCQGQDRQGADDALCLQIHHSCLAMGYDAQHYQRCGRISADLLAALGNDGATWAGELLEEPQTRHEANLASLEAVPIDGRKVLNLRHDRWAARHGLGQWQLWKRSAVLCSLLLVAWSFGVLSDLNSMEKQIENATQRIENAFHEGLPNEPVMLDALAQLRQATGGGTTIDTTFLSSLKAVSAVYRTEDWMLKTLELRDGEMQITGKVKDIETLNRMQASLKKALQKNVKIADTNIRGEQVSFRMQW